MSDPKPESINNLQTLPAQADSYVGFARDVLRIITRPDASKEDDWDAIVKSAQDGQLLARYNLRSAAQAAVDNWFGPENNGNRLDLEAIDARMGELRDALKAGA